MNTATIARPIAIAAAAVAVAGLVATTPATAQAADTSSTEQIHLVVERQADVFMSFDLRSDGAVVVVPGISRTFDAAAESAATVSAPAIGETGQVVFENGTCLQAAGPASSGWTIVSNASDERGTVWERTASGALKIVGQPARAMEYFGNANTVTKRAVTGFENPVGVDSAR
ncbi:hypothetical protein [Curtobacterium sp. VKM Ac-2884]|uniref:hypothetical protein n=1 Tax=Curtobacterium sp. VKM Ac-2884 TaxID=2783818 RepID=UPI00188B2EEE|nr:hypothetical protein [Curtobacterium sp. VKM Ac-2884]MBF4605104.1 hypothetical protein [Curtobacterium sp. VKM Ac-2884]